MNRRSWAGSTGARTVALLSTRKGTALFLFALITASAGLDLAVPFITRRLLDGFLAAAGSSAKTALTGLLTAAAAILTATVLTRAVRSIYNYQLFKAVTSIEDDIRHSAYETYLRLHAAYHRNAASGQVIGRIDAGCAAIFTVLFDILGQSLVPPLVVVGGVLISLAMLNGWIALIVAAPLPLYLLAVRRLTHRIYLIEQQGCEQFEAVAKERYDVAGNVMTVKRFSQEHAETLRQLRLQRRARSTQFAGDRLWILVENFQNLVATAGRVTVIAFSGWLVISGRSTVGNFVLLVTLAEMAYYPIAQLSIILPRLRRSMARIERLFALMDECPAVADRPGAQAARPLSREIEFRDVWFRYEDNPRWILRGINLTIPHGATVALVGRSGSGKTTLTNLIMRLFDPQHGAILLDGTDLRDITQESLRAQIGVVPQEVDLFSRSIAENIGYGKPGADSHEIEAAARLALAHDFICASERGYDTVVGERGLKLSGGERQRIGIARAVLRDPRILILDEATSHLDTESERLIQEATARVVRGRTSFIVAHRLSTIVNADLIAVFDRGTIEAVGTHDELLRSSATYARLYSLFRDGRTAEGDELASCNVEVPALEQTCV